MIQVVEAAIVLLTMRLTQVQERAAEELIFDLAGQFAGRLGRHLQLLVGVVMQANVLSDFVLGDTESRRLNGSAVLAGLRCLQAEILEVINALSVDELNVLPGGSAIGVAQHTLHVVVVVFDGSAHEVSLNRDERRVDGFRQKCSVMIIDAQRAHLVETGRQTGLLGAGVNEGVVQAADDLVGHTLKGPRAHADVLGADVHLDHVVHAVGSLWQRAWVHGLRVILELAECLLLGQERIHDEAEGGGLALGLLVAPSLALVERQILHAVVSRADEVEVCELLECDFPMGDDDVHEDQK
jgi:hypothetical protein